MATYTVEHESQPGYDAWLIKRDGEPIFRIVHGVQPRRGDRSAPVPVPPVRVRLAHVERWS